MSFSIDVPPTERGSFDMAVRKAIKDADLPGQFAKDLLDSKPTDLETMRVALDASEWSTRLAERLGNYATNLAGAWDGGTISATISGHASLGDEPDSLSIQLTRTA